MSATAQTLRPPSKTLMFLEGRAIHELGALLGALPLKSIMLWMELAMASYEPEPMRCPFSQLSSTKRMTDVWSVSVPSTKFCFA